MRTSFLALLSLSCLVAACGTPTEASGTALVTTRPAARDEGWWIERHERALAAARTRPVELVFLGDSITQGWETTGRDLWEACFARHGASNLGFSGDRTQHVLWRLQHGEVAGLSPALCVLMIGTNNSGDDDATAIAAGITAIVDDLERRLPETHVLLLGIFPRGATPDDERRIVCQNTNARIAKLGARENVTYLDLGATFLEPDGSLSTFVMPDRLHLSEEGYARWARALERHLEETP